MFDNQLWRNVSQRIHRDSHFYGWNSHASFLDIKHNLHQKRFKSSTQSFKDTRLTQKYVIWSTKCKQSPKLCVYSLSLFPNKKIRLANGIRWIQLHGHPIAINSISIKWLPFQSEPTNKNFLEWYFFVWALGSTLVLSILNLSSRRQSAQIALFLKKTTQESMQCAPHKYFKSQATPPDRKLKRGSE
jgi:hypothetical protein